MTSLHHFYHVYADGWWETPVTEHFDALVRFGLYDRLATLRVGFVGTPDNVQRAKDFITSLNVTYEVAAETSEGWEQTTQIPMWEFAKEHDGYISYAHTKGAANYAPINWHWRRSMEYYNFVRWEVAVAHLDSGKKIVGCHWFNGGPAENPEWGHGGMFGGTYWWTTCAILRQNVRPTTDHRFAAEHWIGQLSEVMDLTHATYIADMNPLPIGDHASHTVDW